MNAPEPIPTPRQLSRECAIRLMAEAQRSPDSEVCGLIGRTPDGGCEVYPVRNIAGEPGQRFDMDPAAQIDAQRRIRERGQALYAVYHSHPATAPEPSAADLRDHGHPDALQIIISLDIKGVLRLRAWRLDGPAPVEVPLSVV